MKCKIKCFRLVSARVKRLFDKQTGEGIFQEMNKIRELNIHFANAISISLNGSYLGINLYNIINARISFFVQYRGVRDFEHRERIL